MRLGLLLLQVQLQAAAPRPADTAAYWQQDIRYTIVARLDEPSGILTANARLIYRNNSPDTLRAIYFHQYLNAFRPGSEWSRDELRQDIHRFAELPEPHTAYERLHAVSIGGVPVVGDYPVEPDSTVVRFALPEALEPGDSLVADLAWEARLSVIPRRQGRRGRHYDFAQWYPKVAVYDRGGWQAHPLRLQGELYGEFGTYDVTLDVLADQVIGATGVPVAGDPGWTRSATPPRGRKRVRFVAERVHHFAWAADPDFEYERGGYRDVPIHVLYRSEERAEWGEGRAVQRAVRAMAWLDSIFGPYPYPQVTLLRRIEGGGTEFPMLVMLGGAGESLIFHELGHLYTYAILANNEWKEGWLDEGFTTFQTGWNFRRRGMGVPLATTRQLVLNLDLDGWSRPVLTPADSFPEQQIYSRMVYTKGQLVLEMLKYVLGEDTFRLALREYYARHQLQHVTSADLRRAMEAVSGRDLGWFFEEWLTRVPRVDYELRRVRRREQPDGSWLTTVVIERRGDGIMPVQVAIPAGDTTIVVRTPGMAARETVDVRTPVRPGRVALDPDRQTFDWNALNNRQGRFTLPFLPVWLFGDKDTRLGWSGSTPARSDRLVINMMPLLWYSDAGGVTFGYQSRQNYMGRFERNVEQVAWRTGREASGIFDNDQYIALRDPTWLRVPRLSSSLEFWRLDGRIGLAAGAEWDRTPHLEFGRRSRVGVRLAWMAVTSASFLSAGQWDDAGTVELRGRLKHAWDRQQPSWTVNLEGTIGGVVLSSRPRSLPQSGLYDTKPYGRAAAQVVRVQPLGGFELRARGAAAGVLADGNVPRQRRVFTAGADPYATFMNPFLRSRGAPLAEPDAHYQTPGGAGLRAYRTDLAGDWAVALNVELARSLFSRPTRRAFSSVSVAAFGDFMLGSTAGTGGDGETGGIWDAGVGLRAAHRIGPTRFVTRFDVPFVVSRPALAAGARAGDGQVRPRWVWSFEEAF